MKRPLLIVGNALLFTLATGCDDVGVETGDAEVQTTDGTIADDMNLDPDQAVAEDAALADASLADMHPDAAQADQSVPADMTPPEDMALTEDMAAPEDMAVIEDMAAPEDMSPPIDMAEADMAQPEDMTVPEDMAVAETCDDQLGQACGPDWSACCSSNNDVLTICLNAVWQVLPPDMFCGCNQRPDGTFEAICAVPGFVGVNHRAWRPRRVVRLRGLAA